MSTNPYYGQEGHGPYEMIGIGNLELEEGSSIPDCELAVATHGTLNADGDNAILYLTPFPAQHGDIEWMIGPGRALDPTLEETMEIVRLLDSAEQSYASQQNIAV